MFGGGPAAEGPNHCSTFTFRANEESSKSLRFAPPPTIPVVRNTSKRLRARNDVDWEDSGDIQKKKRRLRLDLITSRLSRPYAVPTTNIVGPFKFVKWTRGMRLGKTALRKVASMNWARLRCVEKTNTDRTVTSEQQFESFESLEDLEDQEEEHQKTGLKFRQPLLLQSSPGLSNYEAIDLDGDPYDDQSFSCTDKQTASFF